MSMKLQDAMFLLLPMVVAAAVIGPTCRVVEFRNDKDEGYYLHYAGRVAQQGPKAFPDMVRDYLKDVSHHRHFPPPTRLITIGVGAAAVGVGGLSMRSLQVVSLASFLALLVFLALAMRRSFGQRTAFWSALLVAVSPLHLAMARRALSDSLTATLFIISLWFFIRALISQKSKRSLWAAVAVLYAVMFLAKEGTLIAVPISLALLLWHGLRSGVKPTFLSLCAVSVLPIAVALFFWVPAAGGFSIFWKALSANLTSPATNPYALAYGQGPWFRYLVDDLLLSPWTTLLYLLWLGHLVISGNDKEEVLAWAFIPVLFLLFSAPFTKNVRYALALETPIRLGAILFLQRLLNDRSGTLAATLRMGLLLALLLWMDLNTFWRFFVAGALYDPMSVWLLTLRGFLPAQ